MELLLERASTAYGVRVDIKVLGDYYTLHNGFSEITPLEDALHQIDGVDVSSVDTSAHSPFVFLDIDDEHDTDCTHERVRQVIRQHLSIPG